MQSFVLAGKAKAVFQLIELMAKAEKAEKLEEKGREVDDPFTRLQRYELGAFIDGKLNILEIRDAVSAARGLVPLRDVIDYLDTLESIGLISYEAK